MKALDRVTLFILSQSAPEFSQADSAEQRAAAQEVWRHSRDVALKDCDEIEAALSRLEEE